MCVDCKAVSHTTIVLAESITQIDENNTIRAQCLVSLSLLPQGCQMRYVFPPSHCTVHVIVFLFCLCARPSLCAELHLDGVELGMYIVVPTIRRYLAYV